MLVFLFSRRSPFPVFLDRFSVPTMSVFLAFLLFVFIFFAGVWFFLWSACVCVCVRGKNASRNAQLKCSQHKLSFLTL